MPIYEYRRKTDGSVFEIEQRITDEPLKVCPTTGDPVERLISPTSFSLKGGGWYVTDYKSGPGSETKASQEDKKSKETADTKTSSSQESKPSDSTKAESKPSEPKTSTET